MLKPELHTSGAQCNYPWPTWNESLILVLFNFIRKIQVRVDFWVVPTWLENVPYFEDTQCYLNWPDPGGSGQKLRGGWDEIFRVTLPGSSFSSTFGPSAALWHGGWRKVWFWEEDLFLRSPHRTHHTRPVLLSRCPLALCGGLFRPAGGDPPTNLLPQPLGWG